MSKIAIHGRQISEASVQYVEKILNVIHQNEREIFVSTILAELGSVKEIFKDSDVAVYAHDNGDALKPSSIIDLKTMEYIRE